MLMNVTILKLRTWKRNQDLKGKTKVPLDTIQRTK